MIEHTYPEPGTYQVILTAIGHSACDPSSKSTTVNLCDEYCPKIESISIISEHDCTPGKVTFYSKIVNENYVTQYIWDFGDGVILDDAGIAIHHLGFGEEKYVIGDLHYLTLLPDYDFIDLVPAPE